MDEGPRDVSKRELGQVTPVMLPISKVPGSGAFTGEYSGMLKSVGNLILYELKFTSIPNPKLTWSHGHVDTKLMWSLATSTLN